MISPCINILRKLASQVNGDLGSRQGSKHTTPDIWKDINELKKSLREHGVYEVELGRTIDSENSVVPNVVAEGLRMLPKPLEEYNDSFKKLQERRRLTLLVRQEPSNAPPSTATSARPSSDDPNSSSAICPHDATTSSGISVGASVTPDSKVHSAAGDENSDDGLSDEDEDGIWELDMGDELLPIESEEDVELDML